MVEIIVLSVLAVIVTEVYAHTRHPKLFAFFNSAAGVGGMLLSQYLTTGGFTVTMYNSALSAILGIPGAVLIYIAGV